jgi:PAS domain S-box-containing protein
VGSLVPPLPHLLSHALFVAASGAFFYWLLYFHARTLQRATQVQDIRLIEFIDQITDVAFIKDRQGRYLALNSTGTRLIGRPLAECLGRDDTELFPADVARRLMDDDHQILASGVMLNRERTLPLGGDMFILQTTKWPYRDAEGQVVGILGISRNIAALKRVEEQLRRANDELEERVQARTAELTAINQTLQDQIAARIQVECTLRDSEERFRQLAEHIREVFWVYGISEERTLYVSPAYEDLWGRSAQNLRSCKFSCDGEGW